MSGHKHIEDGAQALARSTAYSIFDQVCGNDDALFFLNVWCHQRLHSTLHDNDLVAKGGVDWAILAAAYRQGSSIFQIKHK